MNWQTMGLVGFAGVGLVAVNRRSLRNRGAAVTTKSLPADVASLLFVSTFPLAWLLPDISASTPNLVKISQVLIHLIRIAAFIYCVFNLPHLTVFRLMKSSEGRRRLK